jgi:cytochrome P450
MPDIFTVDLYKPKMGVTKTDVGYLMAHDDDALHYREKSLMQGMLNRDDIPRVRQLIEDSARDILDKAGGNIEIVKQYCRMVPAVLVQEYFGLDGIDRKQLIEWSFWNQYDAFHNQPFDLNSEEKFRHIVKEHDKVSEELAVYIAVLILRKTVKLKIKQMLAMFIDTWRFVMRALRRLLNRPEKPAKKEDIVTTMLRSRFAKQVDFPIVRLGVNAGGLLIGSIETTSQAVAQAIEYFLKDPALLARAKRAAALDDPDSFDNLVWEALRFVPISPYVFRQASVDYRIARGTEHETKVAAGTNLLLLTQSAMFDPYAFDDPEDFDPERNWYHHFNFGFASHDCLGKYIGMVMIPEMVRQVMLRQGIEGKGDIDYEDGPFPESYQLAWS